MSTGLTFLQFTVYLWHFPECLAKYKNSVKERRKGRKKGREKERRKEKGREGVKEGMETGREEVSFHLNPCPGEH